MHIKPFVIRATHNATGEYVYLAGFETVGRGYSRAESTQALVHHGHTRANTTSVLVRASRYAVNASARALDVWRRDTYAKTAFTGFEIIAAERSA